MRLYRLKRETTEGDFGFYNAQLYVGELSDPRGARIKGVSVLIPNRFAEVPIAVSPDDAKRLVGLIDAANPRAPEMRFQVSVSRFWNFRITLDKHLDDWLGGSGYSGAFFLGFSILGNWVPVKVKEATLRELRDCLVKFYGLH